MLKYMKAQLSDAPTPLARAMRLIHIALKDSRADAAEPMDAE